MKRNNSPNEKLVYRRLAAAAAAVQRLELQRQRQRARRIKREVRDAR
jgi:hypothetical protein